MVLVLKKLKGLGLDLENLQGLGLVGDGHNYITGILISETSAVALPLIRFRGLTRVPSSARVQGDAHPCAIGHRASKKFLSCKVPNVLVY